MASRYWIKFYIEILDDPKMGRLSDRLWRRASELFLLAGECGDDGALPSIGDMAWRLRLSEEKLKADLEQLATANILEFNDHWHVINFARRQAPASDAERQRQSRKQKQKSRYDGEEPVTPESQSVTEPVTSRDVDPDPETDPETESDPEDSAEAPPSPPPKPKPRAKKPKTPIPKAVQAFREIARLFPAKAWFGKVDEAVGESRASLALWREVVTAWVGLGWNPTNVKGMLECYSAGKIPGSDRRVIVGKTSAIDALAQIASEEAASGYT